MRKAHTLTRYGALYLICDGDTCERYQLPVWDFVRAAVDAGVGIIQYRHKTATLVEYEANLQRLLPLCRNTLLIVNDHALLAERYRLWLHLGQNDALPANLETCYGRSTHGQEELEFALSCNPPPAYIALGTMFSSPTKPGIATNQHLVGHYLERTALPLVLIGGITLDNLHELPRSERILYAVISDALRFGATPEGVGQYVREFNRITG